MNIKNFTLSVLSLFFIITSCKKDDDDIQLVELRDETEVYQENLAGIEDYLRSHTFNYEEFDFSNPYSAANDSFILKIDSIPSENPNNKTPIIEMTGGTGLMGVLDFKIVEQNNIDYKLYLLKIRKGLGDDLHPLDRAIVTYNGSLTNSEVFDSAVTPINFNLTSIGSIGGVVTGFREALIEFKTSIGVSTASDGVNTFESHGIGAVFIPSGLGYFASPPPGIGIYNPIIFTLNLINRLDTDFDLDGIPSHLEDIDTPDPNPNTDSNGDGNNINDFVGDGNGFNDDTDGDGIPNFVDVDDDGDGILTINEDLEDTDPNLDSDSDGNPNNDKDGDGDPSNDDTDGDGIPNYLDANATESN